MGSIIGLQQRGLLTCLEPGGIRDMWRGDAPGMRRRRGLINWYQKRHPESSDLARPRLLFADCTQEHDRHPYSDNGPLGAHISSADDAYYSDQCLTFKARHNVLLQIDVQV